MILPSIEIISDNIYKDVGVFIDLRFEYTMGGQRMVTVISGYANSTFWSNWRYK